MSKEVRKFSQLHEDSLKVTAMVCEMAAADGWENLDACFAQNTHIVDYYMQLANAALRGIKRVESNKQTASQLPISKFLLSPARSSIQKKRSKTKPEKTPKS